MDRTIRAVIAVPLIASLAACAGNRATFRAGVPVEIDRKSRGPVGVVAYKQAGEPVDVASLIAGLENVDASRGDARAARNYSWSAGLLAGLGGFGLGYGLVSGVAGHDSGWTVATAGAGLAVIGLGLGYLGAKRLDRAVEAYNAQQRPTASHPIIAPWAATVDGGRGHCVVGGLAARF